MVPKRSFADLLEYLNAKLPSPMRIRYVTSHPRYFSDRVIDAVANLDKVCECKCVEPVLVIVLLHGPAHQHYYASTLLNSF
jgi:hypothetical protein